MEQRSTEAKDTGQYLMYKDRDKEIPPDTAQDRKYQVLDV